MQNIRQRIEEHAANFPYPNFSAYEIFMTLERRNVHKKWRESHPLAGMTIPLINPIPHIAKRSRKMVYLKALTPLAMDLCGGIRFTTKENYWLDIALIDFDKLERSATP